MTRQVKTEFIGPKLFRTWSEDKPLWWILWRTDTPGVWGDTDKVEFQLCKAKYLIYFDHTTDPKARELALYMLDRFKFFKGAKVSKYARDGEKVLVLLGRDDSHKDAVAKFVKTWNMLLWGIKPAQYTSDHEKQANQRWGNYIMRLGKAFGGKLS